jgi:putative SOS response-associated peptidase YedK
MCGRYAITLPPEAVRAFFGFAETPNFPPRFNIAPTQPIPVVFAEPRSAGRRRHFQLMRWGFLPGFAKDPQTFPLLVNARAETLAMRPSFRAALTRRRCLIIADGFTNGGRAARAARRSAPISSAQSIAASWGSPASTRPIATRPAGKSTPPSSSQPRPTRS